jgi:hypothetical protein
MVRKMYLEGSIHPSAWKGYSPKFALTAFSEVHVEDSAYLAVELSRR